MVKTCNWKRAKWGLQISRRLSLHMMVAHTSFGHGSSSVRAFPELHVASLLKYKNEKNHNTIQLTWQQQPINGSWHDNSNQSTAFDMTTATNRQQLTWQHQPIDSSYHVVSLSFAMPETGQDPLPNKYTGQTDNTVWAIPAAGRRSQPRLCRPTIANKVIIIY